MKNLITIFSFLIPILVCHQVKGQALIGVSVGTNLTFPYGKLDPHVSPHFEKIPAYNFSLFFRNGGAHKYNFGTEIIFIQKSYKDKSCFCGLGASTKYDTKNTLSYVNLSPFLEYTFGNTLHFNIGIGPSIGFLTYESIQGMAITTFHDGKSYTTIYPGRNTLAIVKK